MGPDDEYYENDLPEDECDHDDYEVDILTGRATCTMCGHRWFQTKEEMQRDERAEADYAAMMAAIDANDRT